MKPMPKPPPLNEWPDDELRIAAQSYIGPYDSDIEKYRFRIIEELLRRERAKATAELHAKFRADLEMIVEATKQAAYGRCAEECDRVQDELDEPEERSGAWRCASAIRGFYNDRSI